MFKKIKKIHVFAVLGGIVLSAALFSLCFADMSDKGQLGGQDSSNNYSWRVDSNSNLIPGTTAQNSIGSTSNVVLSVYTGSLITSTLTTSGNATVGGTLTVTGKSTLVGGINWDAMKAALGVSTNWTDASIAATGVNWTDIKTHACVSTNCSTSGINWTAFGV